MSDGHFNRALLPKNDLSAGLRAGKAQMRAKATEAFAQILEENLPTLSEAEREQLRSRFQQLLR